MSVKRVILICGGGNGAHCLAGLASLKSNIKSRVLTLYSDEAERWTAKLESGLLITVRNDDGSESLVQTKPSMVTKDPKRLYLGLTTSLLSSLPLHTPAILML